MSGLVGVVGFAGSGKSRVADELVNLGFVRVKFAHPLKEMMRGGLRAAGLDEETIERMIEGDLKEVPSPALGGRTPRYGMVTLGTEWGRNLMASDLWINIAKMRITGLRNAARAVVVDDVRFPNEVETIKRLGGRLWRVERPGIEIDIGHESEQHVADLEVDEFMLNNGTLQDLYDKVHLLLRR